jgi:hypothetical protein
MTIVARPVIAWSSARCQWRIPTALTHAVAHSMRPTTPADTPPTLARSLSRRVSESVRSSLSSELLSRYAHFFDAYVNVRYAWLTLPWLLVQQYVMAAFLGLAVPSGGCDYEQVLP